MNDEDISVQYEWCDVLYLLDDGEDFDLMLERFEHEREVKIIVSGQTVPQPKEAEQPGFRIPESASSEHPAAFTARDAQSTYELATAWSAPIGTEKPKPAKPSIHLIASSASSRGSDAASVSTSKTFATVKTTAPSLHAHVDAFEEFQNSRGVRTFVGSIGPVENVRMMVRDAAQCIG